jgi:hypothetical protein
VIAPVAKATAVLDKGRMQTAQDRHNLAEKIFFLSEEVVGIGGKGSFM